MPQQHQLDTNIIRERERGRGHVTEEASSGRRSEGVGQGYRGWQRSRAEGNSPAQGGRGVLRGAEWMLSRAAPARCRPGPVVAASRSERQVQAPPLPAGGAHAESASRKPASSGRRAFISRRRRHGSAAPRQCRAAPLLTRTAAWQQRRKAGGGGGGRLSASFHMPKLTVWCRQGGPATLTLAERLSFWGHARPCPAPAPHRVAATEGTTLAKEEREPRQKAANPSPRSICAAGVGGGGGGGGWGWGGQQGVLVGWTGVASGVALLCFQPEQRSPRHPTEWAGTTKSLLRDSAHSSCPQPGAPSRSECTAPPAPRSRASRSSGGGSRGAPAPAAGAPHSLDV